MTLPPELASRDSFEKAVQELASRMADWYELDPGCDPSYEELAHINYVAARRRLLQLWDEREKQCSDWRETATFLKGQNQQLAAEVERLRESTLTAEEADWLMTELPKHLARVSASNRASWCACVKCENLANKVRGLSGSPREERPAASLSEMARDAEGYTDPRVPPKGENTDV